MIEYKVGDMFTEDVEALVNSVNCVGVMGRGIALQFKNLFPENFKAYAEACRREEVQPGRMFVFETGQMMGAPSYIVNFRPSAIGVARAAWRILKRDSMRSPRKSPNVTFVPSHSPLSAAASAVWIGEWSAHASKPRCRISKT